jgi:CSLREA domain-containing protein
VFALVATVAVALLVTPTIAVAASIEPTARADDSAVNGNCTLREAIEAANADATVDACPAGSGADRIELQQGTYPLSVAGRREDADQTGDLDIAGDLTIVGDLGGSTIDAGGIDRAFDVHSGSVSFEVLTITRGNAGSRDGGGIRVEDGTTRVYRSTLYRDTATHGGGIASSGQLELDTSTLSNNASAGNGSGGLYADAGTVESTMSTFAYNGGSIGEAGASVSMKGTVLFSNACHGTITSQGYNLIDTLGDCTIVDQQSSDQIGPSTNPDLTGLSDNGGPTETHDLNPPDFVVPESDAFDAGPPTADPDCGGRVDQRGIPRPRYGSCDVGAVEYIALDPSCEAVGTFDPGRYIFFGSGGDETFTGTGDQDLLAGEGGDDRLSGLGAGDCVEGGDGHDVLEGGGGDDGLAGQDGSDTLDGGSGHDVLTGGLGRARLVGGPGDDLVIDGYFVLHNPYGDGGEGSVLRGDGGHDRLFALAGDDRVAGGDGGDRIYLGLGADQAKGGDGGDRIVGSVGDDELSGGAGADRIEGDSGHDVIDCGQGHDVAFRGPGRDQISRDCEVIR